MNEGLTHKEKRWQLQGEQLRNPLDIYGCSPEVAQLTADSFNYITEGSFIEILAKLKKTLLVSREYEHLVLSLSAKDNKLRQGFVSLPHPSGIAVSEDHKRVYIASTRNPNMIMEMGPADTHLTRVEDTHAPSTKYMLMPLRSKYFPGAYYFHDLVFIGKNLYANSVGQNGIVKIDMDSSTTDELHWQPTIEGIDKATLTSGNYLQLNSIAAGHDLEHSYFSASIDKPHTYRPGHKDFPVDGNGVIFNAQSEIVGRGLTRPHSARLFKGEIWVSNSGYGELGKMEDGRFKSVASLPGWTRGLKFINEYAFVGYSVILPRFKQYAPGVNYKDARCGIAILNTQTGILEGSIEFPDGNQIFQIEAINSDISEGFLYTTEETKTEASVSQHYRYKINR